MFLVGLLQWWYRQGWISQVSLFKDHLQRTATFFSIGQLAVTLFAPFRQISAGNVNGPIGTQLRAFFDTLISRLIGAVVRGGTILIGIVVLVCRGVFEGVVLALWFLVPVLPIIGCIVFAIGWVPQWM